MALIDSPHGCGYRRCMLAFQSITSSHGAPATRRREAWCATCTQGGTTTTTITTGVPQGFVRV